MELFEPMLAKPLMNPEKERRGLTVDGELAKLAGWVAELKLDGHRRLMGREMAWSRPRGPSKAMKYVLSEHPLFQVHIPDGIGLDGELVPVDDGRSYSYDVSHLLSEDQSKLKFVVFDLLWVSGRSCMERPWSQRRLGLTRLFERTTLAAHGFELSQVYTDPMAAMKMAEERGMEGIMLKDPTAFYKPGSRSKWVKWKFTETVDCVITDCDSKPSEWTVRPGEIGADGVRYPDGKRTSTYNAGHVGLSYGYWNEVDGRAVRVGSLGMTGPVEKMQPYVGRVVEIKHYGQNHETGALRHPQILRWREDKAPEQCVLAFLD